MSTKKLMLISAAATLAFGLSACGGGGESGSADGDKAPAKESPAASESQAASMDEPFGPACADVPKDGGGSFEGMAADPVATAASNNPALSTLVDAVGKADLAQTLNDAKDITVFAPANSAFDKVPEKDLNALLDDKKALTDVLTYHVVEGKHAPADLEKGDFKSLQGENVKTTGSGEDFKVNGEAAVACGNVQTANATVYIIDSVLMPPK